MLTEAEARDQALAYLHARFPDEGELVVLDEHTRREPFGFVFFYQSRAYVDSNGEADGLVGNAPLVVTLDGAIHPTGTARSLDEYLQQFRD